MYSINLEPIIRPGLDVLFVGHNPSDESNRNGHYFSGRRSMFFEFLRASGLITKRADKLQGDDLIFRGNTLNHKGAQFGIVELVPDVVTSEVGLVDASPKHIDHLIEQIREYSPRIVCILHGKVASAINGSNRDDIVAGLDYGACGAVITGCPSVFFVTYFPGGRSAPENGWKTTEHFTHIRDLI